jgi:hypothetical protein
VELKRVELTLSYLRNIFFINTGVTRFVLNFLEQGESVQTVHVFTVKQATIFFFLSLQDMQYFVLFSNASN